MVRIAGGGSLDEEVVLLVNVGKVSEGDRECHPQFPSAAALCVWPQAHTSQTPRERPRAARKRPS
jgi:hypothetical protein